MDLKQLDDFYFKGDFVEGLISGSTGELFNDGRKFRAQLIEMTGEEFGLNLYQLAPYQRVIEMVHNATLVHDDVIDSSKFRRSSATLNSQFGDKSSVLVGDYILSRALYELSTFAPAAVIKELTLSLKDLVDGELLQNKANLDGDWNEDLYFQISRKKTGSLLRWSLVVPAIITNQDEKIVTSLRKVALELGDLYQIMDDVLDFNIQSSKDPFLDIKNWNINYILILMMKVNKEEYASLSSHRSIERLSMSEQKTLKTAISKGHDLIHTKLSNIKNILENELGFFKLSKELASLISIRLENDEKIKISR